MNNELTFPLAGFKYGARTNVAKGILTNKDAALLILAANGGTLPKTDVQVLLRGWRPLRDGADKKHARYYVGKELHFSYLFNAYYGHISDDYNKATGDRGGWCDQYRGKNRYSCGPYMWRPSRATAAISALGRARLRVLTLQAAVAGMVLPEEVIASAAQPE